LTLEIVHSRDSQSPARQRQGVYATPGDGLAQLPLRRLTPAIHTRCDRPHVGKARMESHSPRESFSLARQDPCSQGEHVGVEIGESRFISKNEAIEYVIEFTLRVS